MLSKKQREDRKLGLGGSDIPIILGLSSYKTPYELFLEKTGLIQEDEEDSYLQYWGHKLEPVIIGEFAERNNVKVEMLDTVVHPIHTWARGNLDAYIPEWNAALDAKCSNQFMASTWGMDGSSEMPMTYLCQLVHYVFVKNCEKGYLAVLIGGNDYREFIYHRDRKLENQIVELAHDFWKTVENNIPPPAINEHDIKLMFPDHASSKTIEATPEILDYLDSLNKTKENFKKLKKIEEECRFEIMKYMADSECLVDQQGRPLITWKSNKNGSRVFNIKEIKEK